MLARRESDLKASSDHRDHRVYFFLLPGHISPNYQFREPSTMLGGVRGVGVG